MGTQGRQARDLTSRLATSGREQGRAALNPLNSQPVLILGIALTQVQDLALGLVELPDVHMVPLLKLIQVPPDGILSLRHVNCTTQLGGVCKLAEGALNPTVYVIDEDIKQYWPLYWFLVLEYLIWQL
ncbi:cAMP-dependent protein kinase inhibitor alpha [Grus japonensis]|uniref:cAMP-dependent protein kinase inhibitor alpha n=1 Tax=Grus japonensis TaxID=30415 RepID=A0ABC9Y9J2_GRUJA